MGGFSCLNLDIRKTAEDQSITGVALAHGLILGFCVWAGGAISGGHFNWAVTITFAGLKRITIAQTTLYIASQTLGSLCAGLAIWALRGKGYDSSKSKLGFPIPDTDKYDITVCFFCEAIATGFLMYMIMALAVDKKTPRNVFGIGIGLALFVAVLSIGPVTGAALNPARVLGPQIVAVVFEETTFSSDSSWIYILAPIFGALLAGFYYEFFILDEETDDELDEGFSQDGDQEMDKLNI